LSQVVAIFGSVTGCFAIDLGLLSTKFVAFAGWPRCCLDAAQATPAIALAGGEEAHHADVVMNAAAIAKFCFRHRWLGYGR
jgi:hypothetical protein